MTSRLGVNSLTTNAPQTDPMGEQTPSTLAIGASDDFRPVWTSRGHTEFVTESEPHITYAEIGRC